MFKGYRGLLFMWVAVVGAFLGILVAGMALESRPAQASFTLPAAVNLSTTVSTSSATILTADNTRRYLLIQNVCAQNIGVNPTGGTAAIGTAGTFTLLPGGSWEFEGENVPRGAMTAISASGSCGISIMGIQ